MSISDKILATHIISECEKIIKLTNTISYEEYKNSTTYQDALIRPIEVIGEAAGNLSKKFERANPDIIISNMIGMRNFLAHQYFRVDLDIVWQTCVFDIPQIYQLMLSATYE